MIRVLVIIAVTGFLVSIVCMTTAVGIAGPEAIANGAWSWRPFHGWDHGWDFDWDFDTDDNGGSVHHHHGRDSDGSQTTRQMAWTGGDSIDVELPANIQYTQADGPAKLVVTGSRDAVADVVIDDGHLRFDHDDRHEGDLTIVLTAPSVSRFTMDGSGKLAIAHYRQDRLTLDLSGDSDVIVDGEAKAVDLTISGSANADLGRVKAQSAKVEIEGSGEATVAPTDAADIDISGSGDVTLLTNPPKLRSNISGSGRVRQAEQTAPAPAPNPAPAPLKAGRRS